MAEKVLIDSSAWIASFQREGFIEVKAAVRKLLSPFERNAFYFTQINTLMLLDNLQI